MTQTNTSFSQTLKAATIACLSLGIAQVATALPKVVEVQKSMSDTPAKLVLDVTGYDVAEGDILVALYTSADAFNEEASPFREATVSIESNQTIIEFDDLPVGEYAFKLFHDVNANGELDTDMFGIPSEDYFFSTDASDPFSAPEFEESKFILPSGKMRRAVDLS